MWTSVAGSEFWWFIDPITVMSNQNRIIQMLKKNQVGWKQLDDEGSLLKVLPMGNGQMIAYGSNGITRMVPTTTPQGAPTFAFDRIADFGIISRSAAVRTKLGHFFVAENGTFYGLSSEGDPTRIGYKEFLESMIGEDVILSYDPDEEDVYIADSNEGFIFTKSGGLCEISKLYTSQVFVSAATAGVFEDTSDNSFELITDALNFGLAGQKTVTSVETIGTLTGDFTAALDYAPNKGQTFARTSAVNANPEGVSYVKAGGYDHRIVLASTDYTTVEVDNVVVKVQYDDKRNTRGLIGTERGQGNVG
jgi:hypothetical protein